MALESIKSKVRSLIEDDSQSFTDQFTYENSSLFTLSESAIVSVEDVSINDLSTSLYTYNSTTKKVTVTASLTAGDTVKVQFTYYNKYSETEIEKAIDSALVHISVLGYQTWTVVSGNEVYPETSREEDNLIALVTSILLEPGNTTVRMPDATITVPKDVSTIEKIRMAVASYKKGAGGTHGIVGVIGD